MPIISPARRSQTAADSRARLRPLVIGEDVRDWLRRTQSTRSYSHTTTTLQSTTDRRSSSLRVACGRSARTFSRAIAAFGQRMTEHRRPGRGMSIGRFTGTILRRRCRSPLRSWRRTTTSCWTGAGRSSSRSAPVIKLPEGASEDDHLRLLGVLNSSTACFWLKQVSHDKGSTVEHEWRRMQAGALGERSTSSPAPSSQEFPLPAAYPLELSRSSTAWRSELATVTPGGGRGVGRADP